MVGNCSNQSGSITLNFQLLFELHLGNSLAS